MTSLSWTSAAPDTEPHTRGDWRLLAAAVGLALFVYAPELGSFSLSIDEEIHGLSDSVAREWVQQGRWGMGLLCSVLPPLQAIPFLPTFLFCLGLAAGAWRAAGLATRSRSEAVFFIATCIICPVWMHIAEFNTLSWGFGIGLAAVMAAAAACAHGGLSSLVAAVLLLAFGIGIYQTLVIPFALVMLMAGIRRVEEPAPWAAAVRPLVLRSIVVLAAALVTYALVSRISLWFIGSGLRYVDGYANLRAFTGPDAAAAVQRTLRTSLGYFTGQSPLFLGWGAAVLTPVWLGCLGGLVGIWRHDTGRTPQVRWGHTAILIAGFGVAVLMAISPIIVSAGTIPARALVGLPFVYAWAAAGMLRLPRPTAPLGWASLGYAAVVCGWISAALFHSDAIARQRDLVLATQLSMRIRDVAPGSDGDPVRLAVVGSWDHGHDRPARASEVFGTSFFEQDGGNVHRIQMYLRTLGIRTIVPVHLYEIHDELAAIAALPAWPHRDSVQAFGDHVVVKFGPPSHQQAARLQQRLAAREELRQ
jgi:hypothetical protein